MGKTCYPCTNGVIEYNSSMFICSKCSNNKIYKTDVIKTYKLDENDLKNLPCGHTTIRHNICTYYFKPHIIEITVQKYGIDFENIFQQKKSNIKKLQESKTFNRKEKIKMAFESNGLNFNSYANTDDVNEYIANGKNIKKIIEKFKLINDKEKILNCKLAEHNLTRDGYYCWLFIHGMDKYDEHIEWDDLTNLSYKQTEKIISSLDNLIVQLKLMRRNKVILETKLMINGLELRVDSQICKDYINGSRKYSLDKIVSIMKEMEFLYTHTNYSQILKETRYKYIGEQRAYGWYEHSEQDEEYVRTQAKVIALKKVKLKPNFDIVV